VDADPFAGGRRRDRHRPAGDAVRGSALDSGGHPVSAPATRDRTVSPGLPFELFLGLRYLRATGQRANLSLFVWIGVGGVFLGVAALILVLAVMTGFQDGIRDKIISANPHLLIFTGGGGLADADTVAGRVRSISGVKSATPFRSGSERTCLCSYGSAWAAFFWESPRSSWSSP